MCDALYIQNTEELTDKNVDFFHPGHGLKQLRAKDTNCGVFGRFGGWWGGGGVRASYFGA